MKNLIIINDNEFETLVAVTHEEHENGLMFKRWPPPIMSFPYKYPAIRKFWMKNTISPLEIIFCLSGKIISIVRGEPLDETHVGPDKECDLVVEVPAGTCKKYGISVGDKIKLQLSKSTLEKINKHKEYII